MNSTKKIIGLDGEKVSSINLNFKTIGFETPFLIHDKLKKKEVEPEIRVYEDLKIIKDIDFILYAKPIRKKDAWAKRQKYIIFLRPEEAPVEKDCKILNSLPSNHFIELDIANSRIRVIGPFVNKNQESEWMNY